MAGPVPLTVPSELSSSTIAASLLPTVSPSLVSAPRQLHSLFPLQSAAVDRKQMAIAALCGVATLACVCGAAARMRHRRALDRQRGGGGGAEVDANRGASSARASLSSGLGFFFSFFFFFFLIPLPFLFLYFFPFLVFCLLSRHQSCISDCRLPCHIIVFSLRLS